MATSKKEMEIAGPAPGRPIMEPACVPLTTRSRMVAWKIDSIFSTFPAAAVPVSVKIPDPMTAPIPKAVMLHGPSVLRSRLAGSSEAAISASILRVRSRLLKIGAGRLTLPGLTLRQDFHFFLHGATGDSG